VGAIDLAPRTTPIKISPFWDETPLCYSLRWLDLILVERKQTK